MIICIFISIGFTFYAQFIWLNLFLLSLANCLVSGADGRPPIKSRKVTTELRDVRIFSIQIDVKIS